MTNQNDISNGGAARCSSPLAGSVWVIYAEMDYEGGYIVGVYESESLANKRKERLEASFRTYERKNQTWTEVTDAEDDAEKWPKSPQMPDHYGCNLSVGQYRVISSPNRNKTMNNANEQPKRKDNE